MGFDCIDLIGLIPDHCFSVYLRNLYFGIFEIMLGILESDICLRFPVSASR